jgi:hypothetical protein
LVAKDKTRNPINFLHIPKCNSQKKERSANWIPTEIVLLVDLVEEEVVLLRSKFSSDVAKK